MSEVKNNVNNDADVSMVKTLQNAGRDNEKTAKEIGADKEQIEAATCTEEEPANPEKEVEEILPDEPRRFVILSEEDLKDIYKQAAAVGANEAIKTFEAEKKKDIRARANRRLRNTKLLLRNYRMLKSHAENAVFSRDQIEDSAFELLEEMMLGKDGDITINSIEKSATRTAIMVNHIDTMLDLYATFCEKCFDQSLERRRYQVMFDMYIADPPLNAEEIADKYQMSTRNVYSDLKIAIERVSSLLFGVDSLI